MVWPGTTSCLPPSARDPERVDDAAVGRALVVGRGHLEPHRDAGGDDQLVGGVDRLVETESSAGYSYSHHQRWPMTWMVTVPGSSGSSICEKIPCTVGTAIAGQDQRRDDGPDDLEAGVAVHLDRQRPVVVGAAAELDHRVDDQALDEDEDAQRDDEDDADQVVRVLGVGTRGVERALRRLRAARRQQQHGAERRAPPWRTSTAGLGRAAGEVRPCTVTRSRAHLGLPQRRISSCRVRGDATPAADAEGGRATGTVGGRPDGRAVGRAAEGSRSVGSRPNRRGGRAGAVPDLRSRFSAVVGRAVTAPSGRCARRARAAAAPQPTTTRQRPHGEPPSKAARSAVAERAERAGRARRPRARRAAPPRRS